MVYPSKAESQKRKTFGLSFPGEDAERIDVLIEFLHPRLGHRKRSEFITEQVFQGLEARFGSRWREFADKVKAEQEAEQKEGVAA